MNRVLGMSPRGVSASLTAAFAVLMTAGPLGGSAMAADTCPNAPVRAQQEARGLPVLPECRAFEMVNPNTDDLGEANRVPAISDDGDIAAYMSVIPDNNALGGAVASSSVARRLPEGWRSTPADPASTESSEHTGATMPLAFSPDFTRAAMVTSLPLWPGDTNDNNDAYGVDVGTGVSRLFSFGTGLVLPAGGSKAADRFVFTYGGPSAPGGVYVGDGVDRQLVSVYPDGQTVPATDLPDPAGAGYERGLGLDGQRDGSPWLERGGSHGVSDDGLRIFFTAANHTYVRDFTTSPAQTHAVTVSNRTGDPPGTVGGGQFIAASHDGATAYFVSTDELTDDATPGGGIYRFDLATDQVTQVTPDAGGGISIGAAMASDDLSHIYFTSTNALASGAQSGNQNAYVWSVGHGVRFIARVEVPINTLDNNYERFSRVTPDGRYALIQSVASIGGAPNAGQLALYRYDDATGVVDCVSCRPNGSASSGAAELDAQSFGFPAGPVTHNRSLTFDGRVVFTSTDRLTADDQTSSSDVYLWDKGTVSLLTSGRGDAGSYVSDISDDGKNIFIISRSALIGSDHDADEYDVYDARVGGGFLEPPPGPDPCRGDDCQGTPSVAPSIPAPVSSRVGSDGNVTPPAAGKRLSLSQLSAAQRSALARTGRVAISVRVTGGGALTVRGRGRVGGATKTLGSVSQVVLKKSATTVKLTFRLSSAARRELARHHRLSVTLEARLSGLSKAVTTTNKLTAKGR